MLTEASRVVNKETERGPAIFSTHWQVKDLERPFKPVVIRAHGQVETEVPISVPRWPPAVR
jgi:hypothetical protein